MAKNSTTDIELLAGLSIDSSEQEILRAIKIIEKRLKANHDARFKLNIDIDEKVINNTITKLQNALKNKDLKIETQDSIHAITKEANAMLDVVDSAKKATQEKLEFAKANQKVRNSADDTANAINRERIAMDNLDDIDVILQNLNMNGRQGNSVFQQFGATLRDAFSTYTVANLLQDAIYKVVDTGKEALDTVKKFDDINVDLQMATGADKDYVKGLISDYAELGGELGALTETVAESADTFLRQGRSMEETNQLISDAVVLSKVAKTEGEKASEILTATINGFQLAATEGSRVNDVLSSIDLNSASSAEGIGEALTKVASMANNAGVSLEKTAAMIATIKDVTQDADTTIGTSLKTVLSRMNQIRAGKFIDESTGEALNDVEKVLGTIGVSMRDINGQFKEAEVIIDDVGTKWKSLDSNTQKAVTTAMGGVYQANKLVSLFDNYDKVIELTKVAEESAGTALQKFNDSYLTSLEAKTNALKSSLQSLATTTISDEFYGLVLDSTKAIVDMTTETGILKGALAGLATAGAVYTFQHLTAYLHDATQEFANLGEAMQITRGATGTITDIQRLVDLTGGLSEAQTRLLLSTNNLTDAQKVAILMNQGLTQEQAEQTISTWGVATAQQGATGATITWNNALRGLWATLMANPLVLVSTAVTVGVIAFNKYKQAQEESAHALEEAVSGFKNATSELKDLESELKTTTNRLEELQKLADNNTISIADEKELELLKEQNEELREKIALKKELQIDEGKDLLKDAKKLANRTVLSSYQYVEGTLEQGAPQYASILPEEELALAFEKYFNPDFLKKSDVIPTEVIEEMYPIIEDVIEAYEMLNDAGYELSDSEKAHYEKLDALQEKYLLYRYELNGTKETFQALNDEYKRGILVQRLLDKGLSFSQAHSVLDSISVENYDNLWDKDFSFIPPEITDYATVEEYGKAYAEAWLNGVQSLTEDEDDNVSLLTPDQLKSIETYKKNIESVQKILEKIRDVSPEAETVLVDEIFEEFGDSGLDISSLLADAINRGGQVNESDMKSIADALWHSLASAMTGNSEAYAVIEAIRDKYADFDFEEIVDVNKSAYDELFDLYNKVQDGKTFTLDKLQPILNTYRDLEGELVKVGEEYTLQEDAIVSLINKYGELTNAAITSEIARVEAEKASNAYIGMTAEELDEAREGADEYVLRLIEEAEAFYKLYGEGNSYLEYLQSLVTTPLENENANKTSDSFSDSIDWASQSISVLEEKVSDLERTLDDAKGYTAQKEAIKAVITELGFLKTGYEDAAKTYEDEYKNTLNKISDKDLRSEIRKAIENGERFDIEAYVGADDKVLHETINDAIDLWNKSEDAKNHALETEIKITGYQIEDLEKDSEIASSIREVRELAVDFEEKDKQKLALYGLLEQQIRADYDAQIKLAEANKDYYLVEQLLYKREKELNDLKKEQLDYTREIEETEANILKYNLDKLENKIDLNDGHGSSEQYGEGYQTAKKIHAEILDQYEKEIQLLKDIENENGTNSSAYREQLYKVHDISLELDEWTRKVKEFGVELLSLPLEVLENAISGTQDKIDDAEEALEGVQNTLEHMDSIISGAQAYIQDQIDAQEELKKPIEEQLEAMKKTNDEREKALALEKAKYELQRAWSQRSVKLYSGEEKGFIYTQNRDDIRDAQDNLANLEYEEAVRLLEKQLEYFDEIIANLKEIQEAWGNVAKNAQDALDIEKALASVGSSGIMDINVAKSMESSYEGSLRQKEQLENEIEELEERVKSLQDLIDALNEIITKYNYGIIDITDATNQMHTLLNENQDILKEINPDTPVTVSIQGLIDKVKELAGVPYTLQDLFGRIRAEIDKFAEADYETMEDEVEALDKAAQSVASVFETFYNLPEGSLAENISLIEEFLRKFSNLPETDTLEEGFGWTSEALDDRDLQEWYDSLKETIPVLEEAEEKAKETGNGVVEMASQYEESEKTIEGALGGMSDTLKTKIAEQKTELETHRGNIETIYSEMLGTVQKNLLKALDEFGNKVKESFALIVEGAQGLNISASVKANIEEPNGTDGELPKLHTGLDKGYVGDAISDSKRLSILQKAGDGELNPDEVIVKLKDDELVLTKMQQTNIAESLLHRAIVPNVNIPDYSHLNNVVQRNPQVNIGDVNINCPGVTSQQVQKQIGDALHKEFGNMALDALQLSGRKK